MIIVKGIDTSTIAVNVIFSNSIPLVQFTFEVFDNFNTETAQFDSRNVHQATCTLHQFSYSTSVNLVTETYEFAAVTLGNTTFNFAEGQYQDLSGDPFIIAQIPNLIIDALT